MERATQPTGTTPVLEAATKPYEGLTPDLILDAVESQGYRCDGRLLALNSYENRVYQVGLEEAQPLVAKFYRAGRWSNEAILEEHAFTQELTEHEIPVVPPLGAPDKTTLHEHQGFRFALYQRCGGRAPELDNLDTLEWLGRFIGRIHAIAAARPFLHRPTLTIASHGEVPSQFLLERNFIPADLEAAYSSTVMDLLTAVRACFERAGDVRKIRLHGDCHGGNVLWTDAGPHFVDFDDCMVGPATQDLWMLLSGSREEMTVQLSAVMEGYSEFAYFNSAELHLIEALRTLRMIHYAGWLARRWDDPAFPLNFPWFNTQRYWQDHVLSLREQLAAMQEPPLQISG